MRAIYPEEARYQADPGDLDAVGMHSAFFVDSPGGCGKTFTTNLILASVRSHSDVALAVTSSRIAALLMAGGTTAHSRFKIPIDITDTSTCNMLKQSHLAKLIKAAKVIDRMG